MTRGSTPTFCFTLPQDASHFSEISIVFVQDGETILQAEKNELELHGCDAWFLMTEENSLLFSPDKNAELQIRLIDSEGTVLISEIKRFPVKKKHQFSSDTQ